MNSKRISTKKKKKAKKRPGRRAFGFIDGEDGTILRKLIVQLTPEDGERIEACLRDVLNEVGSHHVADRIVFRALDEDEI